MEKKWTGEYKADKGKVWRYTEKCKDSATDARHIGEIYDDGFAYAPGWMVEEGRLIEVNDPDFVVMPGFRAVYDNICKNGKKYTFDTGNPVVYPFREMAEAAAAEFNSRPWNVNDAKAYVIEATYEGKRPKETTTYEGRTVHNTDTFMYAYPVGTLVEEEVVDDAIDALPPVCTKSSCAQPGEPKGNRIDENGKEHFTYHTFKRVAKGIWEYCGDCFRGENVQRGKEPVYVRS